MSSSAPLQPFRITRLAAATGAEVRDDLVAVEEPLELRVGGRSVAVLMRTPGHDRELAAGFLVTEGIVRRRDEVLDLVRCADASVDPEARGNVLDVLLAPGASVDWARLTRHVFTSSSCGICSKASIAAVQGQFPPLPSAVAPAARLVASLPERLRAAQPGFAASGGLHASALFTAEGALELVREDVGRHNALDKVIGAAFLAEHLPLAGRVLLVSGRVSFELMQKALAGGIGVVAAISAPTSAAVAFARGSGQTLVGFVREGRMNVYAGTLVE